MPYCVKCKTSITGNLQRCPLCQNDLIDNNTNKDNIFPTISPPKHPYRKYIKLIGFLTIVAGGISIIINLCVPTINWWSLFVLAGIASLWLSFAVIIKKRNNIPKNILWEVLVVSIIAIVWDLFTGFNKWSIDYVLPILCSCAMIAMAVTAKIKKLHIEDYIIYLIIDSIFGIVPLILILCGALTVIYPSAVCVVGSIVSLSALLIFEGTALKAEIIRRMHL